MTESSGIRILHVNDDPNLVELAAEMLEREASRFSVETATSASDGLNRLAADDFDCIVSDYQMPGQNGIEFLETVREGYPDLPFILYTRKGSEEVASEAISAGVTDYLQKGTGTEDYTLLANQIVNAVESHQHKEELKRFKSAVEHAGHAVYMTDTDGAINYVNPPFEEITGYSAEEVQGKNPRILKSGEMTDEYYDQLFDSVMGGEIWEEEVVNRRKNGELYHADQTIAPLLDENDDSEAFVAIQTDITDRKEERERLKFLETLENELIELSTDFLLTKGRDIDTLIDDALETLGKLVEADRSYVFDIDYDDETLSNAYEWCGEGVEPQIDKLQELPIDTFPWWMQKLEQFENVTIPDVSELPAEAEVLQETLQEQNIESLIVTPMISDDKLVGFIGFDWVEEQDAWSQEFIDILRLASELITTARTEGRRQRQIQQLKERFELAVNGAELGVWDWDMTTDEVEFNERWAEMLGHSLDDIQPHLSAWEKRTHPEDLRDAEAALEAHFAGETEYYKFDHRMQTKSDDWIWVRDVGKVVERDDDGEPVRAVGIHQDITTDKEHERKLRETLERSQNLTQAETPSEAATIAVEIAEQTLSFPLSGVHLEQADERLEPVAVTNLLREHLGFAPTYERSGGDRHVDEFVFDVYTSGDTRYITNLEQEYPELTDETPSRSAIIHPLAGHGVFITSAGAPDSFDEFDQYLTELLGSILATTLDRLQQQEYIESQRNNLEVLNQVVRHDIRNDMNVVQGRAELLEDHIDEAGQEHLESLLGATKSAIELTTTGRDLAETMLSSQEDVEPVRLDDYLRDSVENARAEFQDAVITIEKNPDLRVHGNELLEAVFRNLIQNAVVHNDKQIPRVQISTMVDTETSRVVVADNGPGILDDQKETIFGKGETGLDNPGTGIGLYLVQTLVEQYGGEVWVEDNDPEGSVFVVELPVADDT